MTRGTTVSSGRRSSAHTNGSSRHHDDANNALRKEHQNASLVVRLYKASQRGCFTLLNSRVGAAACLGMALFLISVAIQLLDSSSYGTGFICLDSVLQRSTHGQPNEHSCQVDYTDNIAGKSFEGYLCEEPFDAVYTWVNGSEAEHQLEVAFWQLLQKKEFNTADDWIGPPEFAGTVLEGVGRGTNEPTVASTTAASSTPIPTDATAPRLSAQQLDDQSGKSRFEDHDELRYSLRSLERYAGWIRHVYLVTNGQVPTWLNLSHPRITVVPHSAIFTDPSHLPTFSSPAIESHLHRIPNLSRRFLYLNDDTLFGAPVGPADFYSRIKGHRLFYSWPVPQCADGCPAAWLGDGTCDRQCNVTACDYDSGDCIGPNVRVLGNANAGHAAAPSSRGTPPKQSTTHCNGNCADGWLGDRYCDASCNHRDCGFDGLDCGLAPYENDEGFPKLFVSGTVAQRHALISGNASNIRHEAVASMTAVKSVVVVRHHFTVDVAENKAFLVNFTRLLPFTPASTVQAAATARTTLPLEWNSKITSGEFDTPSWVRSATISQTEKAMVVSTVGEWTKFPRTAQFIIEGERSYKAAVAGGGAPSLESQPIRIIINVTLVNSSSDGDAVHGGHSRTVSKTLRAPMVVEELDKSDLPAPAEMSSAADGAPLQLPTSQRKLLQAANEQARTLSAWSASAATFVEHHTIAEDDDGAPSPSQSTQRRLLDLFGDSLKHTNMLLNRKFKSTSRRVPAHMVHLIDRDVMEELWRHWPEEWAATSASKFRTRSNLQYAFMNYYWMVHSEKKASKFEVFDTIVDVDRSGFVERREMRRVALLLWEKEVLHGPLDTIAKDIVAGCEIMIDLENKKQGIQQHHESSGIGASSSVQDDVAPAGVDHSGSRREVTAADERAPDAAAPPEASADEGIAPLTTAATPEVTQPPSPSTAPPSDQMPLGETRDVHVCRAVMMLPTTAVFLNMLHPPPPTSPPAPTSTSTESAAPSSTELRARVLHVNNHSRHWNHSGHNHASATNLAPPSTPNMAASEPSAPPLSSQKPYKPPQLSPEDKIKPMTASYLATVEWLVRAAALGVRVQEDHGRSPQFTHALPPLNTPSCRPRPRRRSVCHHSMQITPTSTL